MSLNGKEDVDDRRVFDERPVPPQVRLMLAAYFMGSLLSARAAGDIDASIAASFSLADRMLTKAGL